MCGAVADSERPEVLQPAGSGRQQLLRRRRAVFQERLCRRRRRQHYFELRLPSGLWRECTAGDLAQRSTEISDSIPIYFSFDASLEGVRRTEAQGSQSLLRGPSITQRMDFGPRITLPLKSFAGGFTLTPSVGFRPPSLAKIFRHGDGTPWFKHIIEPYITWRRIAGIDEYNRTPLVDEQDAVTRTNEVEYGVENRFFVRRPGPDGKTPQAYELVSVSLTQKYFFDPTFGGALKDCGTGNLPGCQRQQFFPLN